MYGEGKTKLVETLSEIYQKNFLLHNDCALV